MIDLDATLVTAHSDKESAAPTFKRGYGFHPLCAFVDHGATGTGEPLAILLTGVKFGYVVEVIVPCRALHHGRRRYFRISALGVVIAW